MTQIILPLVWDNCKLLNYYHTQKSPRSPRTPSVYGYEVLMECYSTYRGKRCGNLSGSQFDMERKGLSGFADLMIRSEGSIYYEHAHESYSIDKGSLDWLVKATREVDSAFLDVLERLSHRRWRVVSVLELEELGLFDLHRSDLQSTCESFDSGN